MAVAALNQLAADAAAALNQLAPGAAAALPPPPPNGAWAGGAAAWGAAAEGAAAAKILLDGAAAAAAGLSLRAPAAALPAVAPSSPPCLGESTVGAGGGLAFCDDAPSPECAGNAARGRLGSRSSASC